MDGALAGEGGGNVGGKNGEDDRGSKERDGMTTEATGPCRMASCRGL